MMRTATLAAALSTAAATLQVVKDSLAQAHRAGTNKLLDQFKAAPRRPASKVRKLTGASYLNWAYFNDGGSCTNSGPYAYSGLGSDGCLTSDDGTESYKTYCSGDHNQITVATELFTGPDCQGDVQEELDLVFDGRCIAGSDDDDGDDDDDGVPRVDDRVAFDNAGVLQSYTSVSITCDENRNIGSFLDQVWYADSNCQQVAAYTGWNLGECLPTNFGISALASNDCTFTYYNGTECAGDPQDIDDDGGSYGYGYGYGYGGDDDDDDDYWCKDAKSDDDYGLEHPAEYFTEETYCTYADDDDYYGDDDDNYCFAGSETVLLQSGTSKAIRDLVVGDVVQVVGSDGSLSFSDVVFLPHGANVERAAFTEIQMASGKSLRATPTHFVMAGECGADAFELTAMQYVAAGRCVQTTAGEDEVTGAGVVADHGVYTVVTKESSGLVVVNGVYASSFGGNHWLVNHYYNLHRAVYEMAPSLMTNRDVLAANLILGDIAAVSLY